MNGTAGRYDLLARCLEYPGPDLAAAAAAAGVDEFAAWVAAVAPGAAEELYVRTFDLQAPCCLEVGWHLFGETYKRGAFLVRLRLAHRAHGLTEGTELPDHLANVLRLLGRLGPEEEPESLAGEAILPAIARMQAVLPPGSPYRPLLFAIAARVAADHGVAAASPRLPLHPEALP